MNRHAALSPEQQSYEACLQLGASKLGAFENAVELCIDVLEAFQPLFSEGKTLGESHSVGPQSHAVLLNEGLERCCRWLLLRRCLHAITVDFSDKLINSYLWVHITVQSINAALKASFRATSQESLLLGALTARGIDTGTLSVSALVTWTARENNMQKNSANAMEKGDNNKGAQ